MQDIDMGYGRMCDMGVCIYGNQEKRLNDLKTNKNDHLSASEMANLFLCICGIWTYLGSVWLFRTRYCCLCEILAISACFLNADLVSLFDMISLIVSFKKSEQRNVINLNIS